jgi:hypothetical protein
MRTRIAASIAATLIVTFAPSLANAAPTVVNVRIEGQSETLFEGPVLTEGHDVEASSDTQQRPCNGVNSLDPQNASPGLTPTAASADAMSIIGETFDGEWYPGYNDYFITRWGPDEEDQAEGAYWGILVNDVFTDVGGCQYELHEDDEVLWVYNAFEERPNLALYPAADTSARPPLTATAQLDQPFSVQVEAYGDDEEDNPPAEPARDEATPYQGADVSPVLTSANGFEKVQTASPQTVATNAQGAASVTFSTPGWHRIKATVVVEGKEDAIRSNRLDICVPELGQSECGPPPAEDIVRTPPPASFAGQPEAEHTQQPAKTGTEAGTSGGSPPGGGATIQPSTHLALERIGPKRLLLELTGPGNVVVARARPRGQGCHRHWQLIKTIARKAQRAGRFAIGLPHLAPGRYRIRVTLAGSGAQTRILVVSRRRR